TGASTTGESTTGVPGAAAAASAARFAARSRNDGTGLTVAFFFASSVATFAATTGFSTFGLGLGLIDDHHAARRTDKGGPAGRLVLGGDGGLTAGAGAASAAALRLRFA